MADKEFRWTKAKIADICDEGSEPIWPGDDIVIYVERIFTGYSGHESFTTRHYCERCGKLLEDSLVTTEACRFMSPRVKPTIPPRQLAAVTFDSEPEARRRLLNSDFCAKCSKLLLRNKEDAHSYIGLLLAKPSRQAQRNDHTFAPYRCPHQRGWHVGRDRIKAKLLEAQR
jgi:hypothetical protein